MPNSSLFPGIEAQSIHSNILNQDMQVLIKLPWSYEQSNKVYPVLYCTDANRSFPLYSTQSLIFETPGPSTEEIIIVGIGYMLAADRIKALTQWAVWRTRDFTPINLPEVNQWWVDRHAPLLAGEFVEVRSGGSRDFLRSIQEEIIPFIETNYRTLSTDRGLAGYSDGGLFTLYTLFQEPELFTRYFAGSPSMWAQLFVDEASYASTHKDLCAKLFISAGAREIELLKDLELFLEKLRSRGYSSLNLKTHVFEDEGHASAYAASISRALCVLYNEKWMEL